MYYRKKVLMNEDWLKKNGREVINAYSIAVANNYDISSTEDVIKILKLIDPADANEEFAKELSKILQLFSMTVKKRLNQTVRSKKPRIIN